MALPLLLRGEKLSLLERDATVLTASQTPDALYPLSRLADARPSQLFIFPSRLDDDYFQADIDQYLNGSFEDWTSGEPNDHTVNVTGTGAVTEETTSPIQEGGSSMEMTNGASGTVEVLQNVEVLAGESCELRYAAQTSNVDSPATLEVFNPYTGKWLTTTGAWSKQRQNAVESVLTSMDEATLSFVVEGFSLVREHLVSLEVRYHMDGASASRTHHWDAVHIVPAVNFTSIHAHNLSAGLAPVLSSSDTAIGVVAVNSSTSFPNNTRRISRSTAWDGVSDGRVGTVSIWFKILTADATFAVILTCDNDRVRIERNTSNQVVFSMRDSGGTTRIKMTSTGTVTNDGNFHHAAFSFDVDGASGDQKCFVDGVEGRTLDNLSPGDCDFTETDWTIGAQTNGTTPFYGEVSDLWFGQEDMALTTGKLLAFRTSDGNAAALGENGELVTGNQPFLYWRGGDSNFTNKGTGGNFDTESGLGDVEAVITNQTLLSLEDVSFYGKLTTSAIHRYWRLRFLGLNAVNPIEIGQWVIGDAIQPAWSPRLQGDETTKRFPQSRQVVEASGEQWAVKKAKHPRRTAKMRFNLKIAQQTAFKDELLARTSQGADPIVIVEDQSQTKVIHGRIPPETDFTRRSRSLEFAELIVEESSNGIGLP